MKFLTLKEVQNLVGFRKTKIYDMIEAGEFPPPFKLNKENPRAASRWRSGDIKHWMILVSAEGDREEMCRAEITALAEMYGPYIGSESWHELGELLKTKMTQNSG